MTTKTNFPVTAGSIVVPYGHVIGNEKWRGSELARKLQVAEHCREYAEVAAVWEPQYWGYCEYSPPLKSLAFTWMLGLCHHLLAQKTKLRRSFQNGKVRLIFEDGLGLVDFHLSNRTCILYISEADLVAGDEFKRRLVRFRNTSSLGGVVIVEKTQISDQYFLPVQKLVVLELGMVLLPVANQGEASQLITQLVREHSKDPNSNPFLRKPCSQLVEASVFQTVQQIPGVGKTKALLLLQQFGSIHRLCNASVKELEIVVGQTVAQQIHTFLCS